MYTDAVPSAIEVFYPPHDSVCGHHYFPHFMSGNLTCRGGSLPKFPPRSPRIPGSGSQVCVTPVSVTVTLGSF